MTAASALLVTLTVSGVMPTPGAPSGAPTQPAPPVASGNASVGTPQAATAPPAPAMQAAQAAPATPFEGYGGMSWGTSIVEAKARYPQARSDVSFGEALPILVVNDEIAGSPARVNYYFVDGKLAQAEVIFLVRSATEALGQYSNVKDALVTKYGRPWKDESIDVSSPQTSVETAFVIGKWRGNVSWAKPGAVLNLSAIWLSSSGPYVSLTAKSNVLGARVEQLIQQAMQQSRSKGL